MNAGLLPLTFLAKLNHQKIGDRSFSLLEFFFAIEKPNLNKVNNNDDKK